MLFTFEAIQIYKCYRQLYTDACQSEILIIEINTCASQWIGTVKNKYI
jgi:hypothetical protein